jgi:hypothetical protein
MAKFFRVRIRRLAESRFFHSFLSRICPHAISLFGFRNRKKFTVYENLGARVYFSLPLWGGQIRREVWACRRNFHDNWLSFAACF